MSKVIECPLCHGHKMRAQADGFVECDLCGGFGEISDRTPAANIHTVWATSHEGLIKQLRHYFAKGYTQVDVWTLRGEWWALIQEPTDE